MGMPHEIFDTVKRVTDEILPDRQTRVTAEGEDYYSFEVRDADGTKSTLPKVWIAPKTTEEEIRYKLRREFRLAFDPDSEPDDLSVPGLATGGQENIFPAGKVSLSGVRGDGGNVLIGDGRGRNVGMDAGVEEDRRELCRLYFARWP
jgi:hypothetical protein